MRIAISHLAKLSIAAATAPRSLAETELNGLVTRAARVLRELSDLPRIGAERSIFDAASTLVTARSWMSQRVQADGMGGDN
jgi:hypothetical protein